MENGHHEKKDEFIAERIVPSKPIHIKIASVKVGWYKGDKHQCKSCGKLFILEKDSQFYCTDECYYKWVQQKQSRSRYKVKECEICRKEYKPTGGRQKYCAKCGLEYWRQDALRRQLMRTIIAEEF